MKKKFFIIATLLVIFSFFMVPYAFAANKSMDNAVNNVRNFVGGAENVVEDAAKDVANGVRSGLNAIDEGAKDVGNDVKNDANNMMNTNNRNTNYNAIRTATGTTDTGLFGTTSNTVWSWLIIAIVAIIIVALVLFYANQNKNTTYHNDDNE